MQKGDERTFQQQKHDPNKITKPADMFDQSDLQLASYDKKSHQIVLLKLSGGHVRPWIGYVRSRPDIFRKRGYMSRPPKNFLLNFDS
jgi:hypothetical protein